MPAGRPAKPLERKRRTGRSPGRDSGGRKLPEVAAVVALPMADGTPDAPDDFGVAARALWEQAWTRGAVWITPATDMQAVVHACRLADDLAVARERYRATRDPSDGKMVDGFHKSLQAAFGVLGFDPSARSRLGIAEVRKDSRLDELLARRKAQ